jgi:hypothetical protein
MSCVLVLLMTIVLYVYVVFWGASTPPFISKGGGGYKKGNRVGYNMIPIRIIFLLAYFTYIFIDIIIYVLENTS